MWRGACFKPLQCHYARLHPLMSCRTHVLIIPYKRCVNAICGSLTSFELWRRCGLFSPYPFVIIFFAVVFVHISVWNLIKICKWNNDSKSMVVQISIVRIPIYLVECSSDYLSSAVITKRLIVVIFPSKLVDNVIKVYTPSKTV